MVTVHNDGNVSLHDVTVTDLRCAPEFQSGDNTPFGVLDVGETWTYACLYAATGIAYAVSYEWLHLSYHLPHDHPVGRSRLIRGLRRHHAIHHDPRLMQRWNLNVTVPLWDVVMRTVAEYPPPAQCDRE